MDCFGEIEIYTSFEEVCGLPERQRDLKEGFSGSMRDTEFEQKLRQRTRVDRTELTKPVSGSTTPDTSLPEDDDKAKAKGGFFNSLRDEMSSYRSDRSRKSSDGQFGEEGLVPHYGLPRLDACCSIQTPMRRRLQTAVVAWHISSFVFLAVLSIYALSNPMLWFASIPYTIYFIFDRAPGNGGVVKRGSHWFRSLPIWTWYCEYFPINLDRTTPLKPTYTEKKPSPSEKTKKSSIFNPKSWKLFRRTEKYELTGPRYIFGYHPHGIGALGAFGAIGTEGCGWSKKFPGINVSLMTLVAQFHVPLYRDYLLALGISAVTRKNSLKVLERNHSICIVVGGARESLMSSIGSVDLVLKRRKGFIRLALESGNVSLVPVFGFGETDCYNIVHTSENSFSHKVQLWMKKNYGFTIPIFYARGLFNYDFGFLPFRTPITVLTGNPIYVEKKISNPTPEQVDHYHDLYVEELKKLYYDNRHKYGYGTVEMQIAG